MNLYQLTPQLHQTLLKPISDNEIKIIIRQHNFTAGKIILDKRLFLNVPRSSKNLFRLFGGGLGINSEILSVILPFFEIDRIRIPYQDELLETTVSKWRTLGIVSPFGNERVDKQIILSLREINMTDIKKYSVIENRKEDQLSLFAEVG